MPGGWSPATPAHLRGNDNDSEIEDSSPCPSPKKRRARRIIISSDSESEPDTPLKPPQPRPGPGPRKKAPAPTDEVIEISSSDDDAPSLPTLSYAKTNPTRPLDIARNRKPTPSVRSAKPPPKPSTSKLPLFVDDSETESESLPEEHERNPWEVNDGSVLVFDEPRTARKPIKAPAVHAKSPPTSPTKGKARGASPKKAKAPALPPQATVSLYVSDSEGEDDESAVSTPPLIFPRAGPSSLTLPAPSTPTSKASTRSKSLSPTKRVTKKALEAAKSARLEAYAESLFAELNRAVFDDRIPKHTRLTWNKRLLSTAGRAHWKKNKYGVEELNIHLATKILDCEERIRHTLAHEMCHLASWSISGQAKEIHGAVFQGWANKMMRRRPDITVSTRHSYDITYPYEWKCQTCSKIYGRFGNTIKVDEVACGACKGGRLVALFQTRATKKTISASGRMGPEKPRDSPRRITVIELLDDSEPECGGSEDEVLDLTRAMGGVTLGRNAGDE